MRFLVVLLIGLSLFGCGDSDTQSELEYRYGLLEQHRLILRSGISNLHAGQSNNNPNDTTMQLLINSNIIRIAEIEHGAAFFDVIDPCGASVGSLDEIVVRLSNGTYVAWFTGPGFRGLTTLKEYVLYQTTDSQSCRFMIR